MKSENGFNGNIQSQMNIEDGSIKQPLSLTKQAPANADDDAVQETIQEEHRIWRKNAPFLYDCVLSHCLTWPSLTCDWLPSAIGPSQQLVVGTHTTTGFDNSVYVLNVNVPATSPADEVIAESHESLSNPSSRVTVGKQMSHPGEVNRALHCPSNPSLIATKTTAGDVLLFNTASSASGPIMAMKGHESEGFALCWSPVAMRLASGDQAGSILVFDIAEGGSGYTHSLQGSHEGSVEGVSIDSSGRLLSSVSSGGELFLWDLCTKGASPVMQGLAEYEYSSVAFCPKNRNVLAVGTSVGSIELFDVRKGLDEKSRLYCMDGGHSKDASLSNIKWSPHHAFILGSSSISDRRVVIWDLSRIGDEISAEDALDGPPEMLFVHGGHTGGVNDFSFSPNAPWTVASVADDNIVQIWRMTESTYTTDSDYDDVDFELDGKDKDSSMLAM